MSNFRATALALLGCLLLGSYCSSKKDPQTYGMSKDDAQRAYVGATEPGTCDGTAPPAGYDGELWYDTTDDVLKICLNSAWQAIEGATTEGSRNFELRQGVTVLNSGDTHNFGNHSVGSITSGIQFTIENTGNRPIHFTALPVVVDREEAATFAMQTQPQDVELAPGATVDFDMEFFAQRAGRNAADLYIESDDDTNAVFRLRLEGYGIGVSKLYAGRSGFTSRPGWPIEFEGRLYFSGRAELNDLAPRINIFSFDGHEVTAVPENSPHIDPATVVGMYASYIFGSELLFGTGEKVHRIVDHEILDVPQNSGSNYDNNFESPVELAGSVYFLGNSDTENNVIFRYDGVEITRVTGGSHVSNFDEPTVAGSRIYFEGYDGAKSTLFAIDGGTIIDIGLPDNSLSPKQLVEFEGNLYFLVSDTLIGGSANAAYYYDGADFVMPNSGTSGFVDNDLQGWAVVHDRLIIDNDACGGNGCYIQNGRVYTSANPLFTNDHLGTSEFNGGVKNGTGNDINLYDGFSTENINAKLAMPVLYRGQFHFADDNKRWRMTTTCGSPVTPSVPSGADASVTAFGSGAVYNDTLVFRTGTAPESDRDNLYIKYEAPYSEPAAIEVSVANVSINENDPAVTVDVTLSRAPNGPVRFNIFSTDESQATVKRNDNADYIEFTNTTYNTPQTIVITPVDDSHFETGVQSLQIGMRRDMANSSDTTGFCTLPTTYPINVDVVSEDPAIVYVTTDGDDSNDGSYENPVGSIAQALVQASFWGTNDIRVADGTYLSTAQIVLPNAISLTGSYDGYDFEARTFGDRSVIVDTQPAGAASFWDPMALLRVVGNTAPTIVDGFELAMTTESVSDRAAILLKEDVNFILRQTTITNSGNLTLPALSNSYLVAYLQDDTTTAYDVDITIDGDDDFGNYFPIQDGEVSSGVYVNNLAENSTLNLTVKHTDIVNHHHDGSDVLHGIRITSEGTVDVILENNRIKGYGPDSTYGIVLDNLNSTDGLYTATVAYNRLAPRSHPENSTIQSGIKVSKVAADIYNNMIVTKTKNQYATDSAYGIHVTKPSGTNSEPVVILHNSINTRGSSQNYGIFLEADNTRIDSNLFVIATTIGYSIYEFGANTSPNFVLGNNFEGGFAAYRDNGGACTDAGSIGTAKDCNEWEVDVLLFPDGSSDTEAYKKNKTVASGVLPSTSEATMIWDTGDDCALIAPGFQLRQSLYATYFTDDHFGNNRAIGSNWSLGAMEYQGDRSHCTP